MKINFGKYDGETVDSVFRYDKCYIEWIISNKNSNKNCSKELKEYCKKIINNIEKKIKKDNYIYNDILDTFKGYKLSEEKKEEIKSFDIF